MYAGRLGLKVIIFGREIGGTITLAHIVENYPGFKSINGMELSNKIKEHALVFNPEFVKKNIDKISKKGKDFLLNSNKERYLAKTVILSTGTIWKKLNIKGEKQFEKKGVHYCALCDGPFYKNKIVTVVGGSDSAVKEALFLSKIASKVFIICRGEKIKPEPINLERLRKIKNIEIIKKTNILEFIGDNNLRKIKLDKKYKNSYKLKLDAVFVDIGRIPITEIAKNIGVKLNKNKEIITNKLMKTNISGFFAAGDVTDTSFKQAITAASDGSIAAYSAYEYLSS